MDIHDIYHNFELYSSYISKINSRKRSGVNAFLNGFSSIICF